LQELPDPITKLVWENVILLSPKTADSLGLVIQNKENNLLFVPRVTIQLDGRTIVGPRILQRDRTVACAFRNFTKLTIRALRSAFNWRPTRL